jgi:hypothetical protein
MPLIDQQLPVHADFEHHAQKILLATDNANLIHNNPRRAKKHQWQRSNAYGRTQSFSNQQLQNIYM